MPCQCQYCKKMYSTIYTLKIHQERTKACMKLREDKVELVKYDCDDCESDFSSKHVFEYHKTICLKYNIRLIREEYDKRLIDKNKEIIKLETAVKDHNIHIKQLEELLANKPTHITNNYMSKEEAEIITEQTSIDIEPDENTISPLKLKDGFCMEYRDQDNYVNITDLCKAGGKQFDHWNSLERTKTFIQALSSAINIPTSDLIEIVSGSNNNNSKIWVHPQIAVNIAQWVSPQFDIKVSNWVCDLMTKGKIDLTKKNSQLEQETKKQKIRIKFLENKYLKKQPRTQYEERNVVYIITTSRLKKDRIYIIGKAGKLTSRLSVYNKTDEHEVVFYVSCDDAEIMTLVETNILRRLKEYKERSNRDRFILPIKEDIKLFSDELKKCKEFVCRRN